MNRSINSFDSNWSVGNPNSVAVDPTIPDLWEAPSVDQLMEVEEPTVTSPRLPWWIPPAPVVPVPKAKDPFGPIPVVPNLNKPPIEVDPPSRPPEWMFGPPQRVEPATEPGPRGLPGMIEDYLRRSAGDAAAPVSAAGTSATAQGSIAHLLMDYIRRQKQRNADGQQASTFDSGAPPTVFGRSADDSFGDKSSIRPLSSPLLGIIPR